MNWTESGAAVSVDQCINRVCKRSCRKRPLCRSLFLGGNCKIVGCCGVVSDINHPFLIVTGDIFWSISGHYHFIVIAKVQRCIRATDSAHQAFNYCGNRSTNHVNIDENVWVPCNQKFGSARRPIVILQLSYSSAAWQSLKGGGVWKLASSLV